MLDDYPTYSGKTLELYFKQKMQESFSYRAIGSWWEPKGNQNEFDIVGVYLDDKPRVKFCRTGIEYLRPILTGFITPSGSQVTFVGSGRSRDKEVLSLCF